MRIYSTAVAIVVAALLAASAAQARRRNSDDDDFPNYNRLEYAKPLPPVDQQVPEPKPGSFHMRVGDQVKAQDASMEDIPVQLMDVKRSADESEPPLDFAAAEPHPAISTPTVTSAPATK